MLSLQGQYTEYNLQCPVYSLHCKVYTVQNILKSFKNAVFNEECPVSSVQCSGSCPHGPISKFFPVGSYSNFTRICVRVWEGQNDRLTNVPIYGVRMCDCNNVSVGDLWELLSTSTS